MIKVSRAQRSKKKHVTIIVGLKTFGMPLPHAIHTQKLIKLTILLLLLWLYVYIDIDLKKASKSFAQHFSCGSSVTGDDEIVIQGDVTDDVIDFIQEKWPEVNLLMIINVIVVESLYSIYTPRNSRKCSD